MTRSRSGAMAMIIGSIALVVASTILFLQIEVSTPGAGPARSCGSAFDAAVDRAGWQIWWSQDLEDPDVANRQALVRTNECPSAVNLRLVIAGLVAAAGLAALTVPLTMRGPERPEGAEALGRLRSIGVVTALVGALLTLSGVVAVVFLVADADSTLFLYTDRTVVALAGVVVLVPAIALAVGGAALRAIGDVLESRHD